MGCPAIRVTRTSTRSSSRWLSKSPHPWRSRARGARVAHDDVADAAQAVDGNGAVGAAPEGDERLVERGVIRMLDADELSQDLLARGAAANYQPDLRAAEGTEEVEERAFVREGQRALGDSGGAIGARVIADAEHLTAAPVEDEETLERVVDVVHAEVELDAFTRSGAGALDEGTAVLEEREAADGQRRW